MEKMSLLYNAVVINPGTPSFVLPDGAVLIQDDRIVKVGPSAELLAAHKRIPSVDCRGKVLMPGLINGHMHFYSTFVCGLAGEPAHNFPEILERLWWKLDRALSIDDCFYSTMIPLHRGILSGTTTVIDHHASPYAVEGSLDAVAEACKQSGIRACLCYETSDRDGMAIRDAGIKENARFAERCNKEGGDMLKGLMGLHASMTLSDETLQRTVAHAKELGTGVHVHAAEDLSDQKHCVEHYGRRVVERFYDAGVLGPKTILGHCIHVDAHERQLLKQTGTFVAHNPESNMNNAVGAADVIGMLAEGIHVGLGTDAMTSDMRMEARIAMLLQRQVKADPTVGFGEAVTMLVHENARYASNLFGVPLGVIEPGAKADIILVEHFPFTPISVENWYGHFLFGVQPSRVSHMWVNGEPIMADGKVLTVSLEHMAAEARKLTPSTWQRFREMK